MFLATGDGAGAREAARAGVDRRLRVAVGTESGDIEIVVVFGIGGYRGGNDIGGGHDCAWMWFACVRACVAFIFRGVCGLDARLGGR